MLSQENIKKTLEELIHSKNLQEVFDSIIVNLAIARPNIVYAKARGELTMAIKTTDGRKMMYNFLKKEEFEKALKLFT